jgi:DUF971 family protein
MNTSQRIVPVNITPFPNGEIAIRWSDGQESFYNGRELRCACACASCVDEVTGEKLLVDDQVPADVHAREIHRVGNYGISVLWSDGHDTGIYPLRRLRESSGC